MRQWCEHSYNIYLHLGSCGCLLATDFGHLCRTYAKCCVEKPPKYLMEKSIMDAALQMPAEYACLFA